MHLSDQKHQLRAAITERLQQMAKEQRLAEGRSLSRRILEHIQPTDRIAAYFPLKTEADIRPLLLELFKRDQILYLPVFKDNKMILRQCTTFEELKPGELNIPEPSKDAYEPAPAEVDVVLVPGRAFDRNGNRLGRGAGGFDRWIHKQRKKNVNTQFIGVCFECQLMHAVPIEEHDEPMDAIITARSLIDLSAST